MQIEQVASRTVRLRRFVRQLHRWLGLLIAIQILFWVVGGLVMSALRLEAVRGEHLTAKPEPPNSARCAALRIRTCAADMRARKVVY